MVDALTPLQSTTTALQKDFGPEQGASGGASAGRIPVGGATPGDTGTLFFAAWISRLGRRAATPVARRGVPGERSPAADRIITIIIAKGFFSNRPPSPATPTPDSPGGSSPVTPVTPPTPTQVPWTPVIPPFVAGSGATFDMKTTLPPGAAPGGVFSVHSTSAPLPAGMTLSPDGILSVGTAEPVTVEGVIFAYDTP
jgi:hypothetical protein